MKRTIFIKGLIFTALCALVLTLTSCADINGLHNQQAAKVTFVFTNFAAIEDGEYTLPGNFNSWDNETTAITIKSGEGTSSAITIKDANIKFSIVKPKSWLRAWYPAVKGNAIDENSAGTPYWNFYIDGLDLNAGELTLIIDGTNTAKVVPTVK
ncbi:MAG: hypothetical protein IJP62_12370 [Treponema sp.]|nr:hypothetical protein [Treponema sp.]